MSRRNRPVVIDYSDLERLVGIEHAARHMASLIADLFGVTSAAHIRISARNEFSAALWEGACVELAHVLSVDPDYGMF